MTVPNVLLLAPDAPLQSARTSSTFLPVRKPKILVPHHMSIAPHPISRAGTDREVLLPPHLCCNTCHLSCVYQWTAVVVIGGALLVGCASTSRFTFPDCKLIHGSDRHCQVGCRNSADFVLYLPLFSQWYIKGTFQLVWPRFGRPPSQLRILFCPKFYISTVSIDSPKFRK